MGEMGGFDEGLGLPQESDPLRRGRWLSKLATISPDEETGTGPTLGGFERRQPRLAQLMTQGAGGAAADMDSGAGLSSNMQTPQRSEFEAWRHPSGTQRAPEADLSSKQLFDRTSQVVPETMSGKLNDRVHDDPTTRSAAMAGSIGDLESRVGRHLPLADQMNASVTPGSTDDLESRITGPQRLLDKVNSPAVAESVPTLKQRVTQDGVTAANARLQDAMKPHGIEALHATAGNPILRGLERFGIGGLKVLDAVGSVYSPRMMAAIPGTRLNELVKRQGAQGQFNTAVEDDLKEAQADNFRSEAEARHAKPDLEQTAAERRELAEQYGLSGDDRIRYILSGQIPTAGQQPEHMDTDQGPIQFNRQTRQWEPISVGGQRVGSKSQAKPDNPEQQEIDYYTKQGYSLPDAVRMSARDRQAPERPQRDPQQLAIGPDGKVIALRPGVTVPGGTRTVTGDLAGSKPSADEIRRGDLAKNMNENLDQLEEILGRRPDLFGMISGRATAFRGWAGTNDPDIASLKAIKEFMGMAAVGAHAMRNAQHVETAANAIVNGFVNGPDAIRAAIKTGRSSLQTFIDDSNKGGPGAPTPGGNQSSGLQNSNVIYARDPQGRLHKGTKGTPLPQGWRLDSGATASK